MVMTLSFHHETSNDSSNGINELICTAFLPDMEVNASGFICNFEFFLDLYILGTCIVVNM